MSMTGDDHQLVSNVLIFEADPAAREQLKAFCAENDLVGVRESSLSVMKMLCTNVDLGAVLISEHSQDAREGILDGFELARRIHAIRRELPIFMRRDGRADLDDIDPERRKGIAGAYRLDQPETLVALIKEYLADTEYPIALIRRIQEVSQVALSSLFRGMNVEVDLPYLTKDKLARGDILSLIPVESPWFAGYMMLQTDEAAIADMIEAGRTAVKSDVLDFRDVMGLLSEIANLSWGGLRTRLISMHPPKSEDLGRISVPITINQYKEFISFGTDRSQLCFKYTLLDTQGKLSPVVLYQKFIFNIRWLPEAFREADENTVEQLVESGSLELF